MRQSVQFLVNTPGAQGAGQADSYSVLLTTRGRLRRQSANRTLQIAGIESQEKYELICRFQQNLESYLRVDMKIIIDSQTYTLDGLPEVVDQIKHWYKFILSASSTAISPDAINPSIGTFIVS